MSSRGSITVGELRGKLTMLEIACHRRDRRGRLGLERLDRRARGPIRVCLICGRSSIASTRGRRRCIRATVLLPGFSAVDDDPFRLNFDENGHATISVNGGPATSLTGTLVADPSNPAHPLVLTYLLPEPV